MSELLHSPNLSIDDYQTFVEKSRRDNFGESWREHYSPLISQEFMELLTQHGDGMIVLMNDSIVIEEQFGDLSKTKQEMAEELGDLLWFGVSTASYLGENAKDLCAEALTHYTGYSVSPIETFADLERAVAGEARKIKVPSKSALWRGDILGETGSVYLEEDPGYVFNRVTRRLIRVLNGGDKQIMAPVASMMEPIVDPRQATGDFLNVLVYIASRRLRSNIEDVARGNIEKLEHRRVHGKPAE